MAWSLRRSYTVFAPLYDCVIERALREVRLRSLAALPPSGARILIDGIGTGLDLPHLPAGNRYVGIDITAAMLARARARLGSLDASLVQGDSMRLPFADASFDHALLHLIVAVVPDSVACLREAARVVKPGGRLFLLDKFLRPGERAHLRRAINVIARRFATRTDVVFEEVLAACTEVRKLDDQPALMGGWFRIIVLQKSARL